MNRAITRPDAWASMLHLGAHPVETHHGVFDVHVFRDLVLGRSAMAIVRGELASAEPLLARVHSSCLTSETLHACDCDCAEQLGLALETVARAGRGIVFYLMQEGRGAGLTAKARDRMIVQASGHRLTTFEAYAEMGLPADLRRYDEVAKMCRLLGIRAPLELLTNNPDKARAVAAALAAERLEIRGLRSVRGPASPFNSHYLDAKHRSGHALEPSDPLRGGLPPEPVEILLPFSHPGAPHLVTTARYLLPIALPGEGATPGAGVGGQAAPVDWFSLRVVYDRRRTREHVVLSKQASAATPVAMPIHRRITMGLADRLPVARAPRRGQLVAVLCEIRDRGVGAVAVEFDDSDLSLSAVEADGFAGAISAPTGGGPAAGEGAAVAGSAEGDRVER